MASARIAIAEGDGIGPEIMGAVMAVLQASGAKLDTHKVEIGEKVYLKGLQNGIDPGAWEVLRHTQAFLKAPITTPQGGGFKSINVTIRTALGLYANIRPCVAYQPFVRTKHPGMDVVIVRENEEDLYVGMEYQQSAEVAHAIKIISRSGCERIVRYAFDYARSNGRKKVTCFTKDNILKLTDGMFHKIFEEIGREYADIQKEHWIVDIGAAKLADTPEAFDLIVLPNLYGDILSDVAAQIAGSVGLAGSANIGIHGAMFEAIHGSAPRRAGQNLANPSGLLLAAVMMLVHLGQNEVAARIHNAWLVTLEEGIHTYDIFQEGLSRQKVGTREFGQAVVERLGRLPHTLKAVSYQASRPTKADHSPSTSSETGQLVGVDITLLFPGNLSDLQGRLKNVGEGVALPLTQINNRGSKVWPDGLAETSCIDQWRCRFLAPHGAAIDPQKLLQLQQQLLQAGLSIARTENLFRFGDRAGY